MSHPIVGQGGFNVARMRNMGAFEAIERRPVASGQTHAQAIRERNLSQLMADIGVAPAVLSTDISPRGLAITMVRHGQDLTDVLKNGGLIEGDRRIEDDRLVRLNNRDLIEMLSDLRLVVCRCADAGFAHLDIKNPNIVVRRSHGGNLKARLIDWDSEFISNVKRDEKLLQALKGKVSKPCEVLRCTYCIVMWALFFAFAQTFAENAMGEEMARIAEGQLRKCKINQEMVNILSGSHIHGEFMRLLEHFVGHYLGIHSIKDFFSTLKLKRTDGAGVAFGVSYDSPFESAAEVSEERSVYGNFPECPPPPSHALSNFSILGSSHWERPDALLVRKTSGGRPQADMDQSSEMQRQKNLAKEQRLSRLLGSSHGERPDARAQETIRDRARAALDQFSEMQRRKNSARKQTLSQRKNMHPRSAERRSRSSRSRSPRR